jgi:hypothetical protein
MVVVRTTLDPGFRRDDSFEVISACDFKIVLKVSGFIVSKRSG